MKVQAYVKVKKGGVSAYGSNPVTVSISKTKPDVLSSEVVILLNLDIPDELFTKPALEANIIVKAPPSSSVPTITIEAGALTDWINKK